MRIESCQVIQRSHTAAGGSADQLNRAGKRRADRFLQTGEHPGGPGRRLDPPAAGADQGDDAFSTAVRAAVCQGQPGRDRLRDRRSRQHLAIE